jgi:hypothetical protein
MTPYPDAVDADDQLRVIGEVVGVCDRAGVDLWLRGGWAMDFFLGEVTRPHRDIDFFCPASDADRLVVLLQGLGYHDEYAAPPADPAPAVRSSEVGDRRPAPGQQRDLVSPEGADVSFALFARDHDGCPTVAGGPYAGERWPADLLDGPIARLGDVRCRIAGPRAQIEIKQMMPVWVPGLPRREKDAADITRLQMALDRRSRGDLAWT